MATQLDLQEQEQLDALKAFWKQYGNLITWLMILALGAFAAFNGWQWYQREQGLKAGAMYDALAQAAEAGDAERSARVFADLKERYARTTYAQQGGLLAARVHADKGQTEAALAALAWVADQGREAEYRSVARLRAAGLLMDQKKYDEALKQLDAADAPAYAALVADRRGDVLMAQGKPEDAKAAYRRAYDAMAATLDYRRLVEAKLTALGAAPAPAASGAAQ
jgi:predicted negative regulator of RcsB-dependent stress response